MHFKGVGAEEALGFATHVHNEYGNIAGIDLKRGNLDRAEELSGKSRSTVSKSAVARA